MDEVGLVWLSLVWGFFFCLVWMMTGRKMLLLMEEIPTIFYTLREDNQDKNDKSNIR